MKKLRMTWKLLLIISLLSVMAEAAITVTVSPSTATVYTNGGQQQFTATVTGTSNKSVVWSISGCSGPACGSISASGLYKAPSSVPNPPTLAVKATSVANRQVSGSAAVTIAAPPSIRVTVLPASATVAAGAQQRFTTKVTGTNNTAVTWSVSGMGCVSGSCGTVDQTGLYTAPPTVPNPSSASVIAKSQADPTKSGSATVLIVGPITVTVMPTTATVKTRGKQQFTATVAGTKNQTVTWSVSGAGCMGSACGSVSSTGLYKAPGTVPNPPNVNVTATSQAAPSKQASAVVTIGVPIVVSVLPSTVNVSTGGKQQFQATVTGSSNPSVTWSVSGPGCNGSACGMIDQTGFYTAPGAIPSPPVVTVTATAQADNSSYGTATITIVQTGDSKLNGQYAFLFRGFDQLGAYEVAGSITADAQGNITTGLEDVNATLGPWMSVPITGTYQIGGDSRGTMTITSALGSFTYAIAMDSKGKNGRLIEFDATGIRGSGVLKLQDPSAFNTAALNGGYAISLEGLDLSGSRVASLGSVGPSGAGFVAGNALDVNDAGTVFTTCYSLSDGSTYCPGFTGAYSVDGTGRGTMMLNVGATSPGLGSGTLNFAFYVVSKSEFLLVSIDPLATNGFILAGYAYAVAQSGTGFNNESFMGASIFDMAGLNTFPEATIGMISWFPADPTCGGSINVTALFNTNSGGTLISGGYNNCAYDFYDIQPNSRGTVQFFDASGNSLAAWFIYAIAPNQAFVMDGCQAQPPQNVQCMASSAAGLGEIKPRTNNSFANNTIIGNFVFGSGEPVANSVPVFSGAAYFDGSNSNHGQGNVTGAEDESTQSTLIPDQVVAGLYSVSRYANNGSGSIVLTSPSSNYALWVISPLEFVAIDTDASATQPTVLHYQK